MSTQLEIVNLALHRLGVERIASLADNNKRARIMSDFYDLTRDNLVKEYQFSFAIKEVTLTDADLTGNTPFSYEFEYDLPADNLRILDEYNENEYKVLGKVVQSDAAELKFTYIAQITDESEFTPDFTKAFYLLLASETCVSLTQDKTLKSEIYSEYLIAVADARANDSRESTPEDYEIDDFLDVRY